MICSYLVEVTGDTMPAGMITVLPLLLVSSLSSAMSDPREMVCRLNESIQEISDFTVFNRLLSTGK